MHDFGILVQLANLCFSTVGIYMAHTLYKTKRTRIQAIITWVIQYMIWIFGVYLVLWLIPGLTYEMADMIVGFSGIFAYLYLFPDIPVPQRVFTYFMVDTSMVLIILFGRATSEFLWRFIPVSYEILFAVCYYPVLIWLIHMYRKRLKKEIQQGLESFQNHLMILAAFACIAYITILLQVDVFGKWDLETLPVMLKWYGLILIVVMGYVIAFRTLGSIQKQSVAENERKKLEEQLVLSEQYYGVLVDQVENTRRHNHDIKYHMNTLKVLVATKDFSGIEDYVADLDKEMPKSIDGIYCGVGAVNALLQHFSGEFKKKKIEFRCQANIPVDSHIKPIHLCVIIGNALQNALEEIEKYTNVEKRWIELKIVPAKGSRLVISVSNPCNKEPESNGENSYRSNKKESGHGFGISNINATVAAYQGWSSAYWKDGIFYLQAVLPINKAYEVSENSTVSPGD